MRTLITYVLLLITACAFAEDPPLPPDAQKVIDKQTIALEAAKKAYDAAVAKANADAAKGLEPVVVKLTKAGDLNGALAVKAAMEKIASDAEPIGNPAKGQYVGKLYVSCGDKVNIFHNGMLVGNSSQWGQLVPIALDLAPGDNIHFVSEGSGDHSTGIAWIYIADSGKWFNSSSLKNTLGTTGRYNETSAFATCIEGPTWVNSSLLKRLDDNLGKKALFPVAIEAKIETQHAGANKVASYKWTFNPREVRVLR